MNTNHAHRNSRPGPACSRFELLLSRAALGLLEPGERQQLQAHVAGCGYCQSRQAAYDRLDAAFRRHVAQRGTVSLRTEDIFRHIRAEEGLEAEEEDDPPGARPLRTLQGGVAPGLMGPPARRPRRGFSWVAAVAAVLVIALITSGLIASHHSGGRTVTGQATVLSTVTPTATSTPVGYTPTPEANPYPPYTGTLVWNDPLSDNSQGHQWDVEPVLQRTSGACQFSGGAYQVVASPGFAQGCFESASMFSNFTLQVNVAFAQSNSSQDAAGIIVRKDSANSNDYYQLALYKGGDYYLTVCKSADCSQVVFQGVCRICQFGPSQEDTLALVVTGDTFAFYVNGHALAESTDATYSKGVIGFLSLGFTSTTFMAYRDLKVWQM